MLSVVSAFAFRLAKFSHYHCIDKLYDVERTGDYVVIRLKGLFVYVFVYEISGNANATIAYLLGRLIHPPISSK